MKKDPACYDLHLHTFWSYDASANPEAYFIRARELGVRCLAITEHHQIDSAGEVAAIAARYPEVRWIPSAELSVHTTYGSIDLLCYRLPLNPSGPLAEVLEEYHQWQRAAGAVKVRGMQALGYDYSEEDHLELLRSYRPERVLACQGATHVRAMTEVDYFVKRGFIADREAFPALRDRLRQEIAAPPYPAVERVVAAVKQAGGLVVIAHPSGYFRGKDRYRMDALSEECSLDGIECAHRIVDPELTAFYRAYCRERGWVSTAGSDSHHDEDILTEPEKWGYTPERRFASHIGQEAWLDEFLERLS